MFGAIDLVWEQYDSSKLARLYETKPRVLTEIVRDRQSIPPTTLTRQRMIALKNQCQIRVQRSRFTYSTTDFRQYRSVCDVNGHGQFFETEKVQRNHCLLRQSKIGSNRTKMILEQYSSNQPCVDCETNRFGTGTCLITKGQKPRNSRDEMLNKTADDLVDKCIENFRKRVRSDRTHKIIVRLDGQQRSSAEFNA
jgi:hypothetical protein